MFRMNDIYFFIFQHPVKFFAFILSLQLIALCIEGSQTTKHAPIKIKVSNVFSWLGLGLFNGGELFQTYSDFSPKERLARAIGFILASLNLLFGLYMIFYKFIIHSTNFFSGLIDSIGSSVILIIFVFLSSILFIPCMLASLSSSKY
ncbi:TPA: hypothetical protein VAX93_001439 [Streptococcus agalactiae]|nr:hypothetical protein [Streptococcus agalactiae]